MGARQLGCRFYSIWHLPRGFLNLKHSGSHFSPGHVFLCLLGPSQLLWPAIMFCPKELCRYWAQVAHGQIFPGIPRGCFWFGFATTPLRRASPTPLAFLKAFFSPSAGIQVQELTYVAAVGSWSYSLCSNQSRIQEIWEQPTAEGFLNPRMVWWHLEQQDSSLLRRGKVIPLGPRSPACPDLERIQSCGTAHPFH